MNDLALEDILEALLMTASEPLTLDAMRCVFDEWEKPTQTQLQEALLMLSSRYDVGAIELQCVAGGYRLQTKSVFGERIARLMIEKPPKYSQALLEVLAIIAYKQPVTRADIEDIRGVAVSSSMLKSLIEREWIHITGVRDVPGKPAVYNTTKAFLDYFNLASLEGLPPLQQSTISHE